MAGRKNFPGRVEARQASAAERQSHADKLSLQEKLAHLDEKGERALKERDKLAKKIEEEANKPNKATKKRPKKRPKEARTERN